MGNLLAVRFRYFFVQILHQTFIVTDSTLFLHIKKRLTNPTKQLNADQYVHHTVISWCQPRKLNPAYPRFKRMPNRSARLAKSGGTGGNRTLICSLQDYGSPIELRTQNWYR